MLFEIYLAALADFKNGSVLRREVGIHAVRLDTDYLGVVLLRKALYSQRGVLRGVEARRRLVKLDIESVRGILTEVELRELGIGIDIRYSVRKEERQIEISRVSVPRAHSVELAVDEPGVLGQIRAARVDIALGRDVPVSRVIADRVLLFVVCRELFAERGAVCAGRRVNINNIVGVDSGARADIVLSICNYRYLCACVLSAPQALAHVSHGVVVHLVALCYQLGVLDGVKIFCLELLVLVRGNEVPNAAEVNNYIEQILMNDIVERLIEAGGVEAERLDEPLVFIFLAEAYLDIFYKSRNIEMDVALEQVNDELRSAYRGRVHYRAVNIALCAVIIEICRSQLTAVAESVEIDFPASGELLHFLNELVELGGVFDLTHAPVLGESEVVLRAYALDEIGRDLFFGYVFVLAFCLEDGCAGVRRALGID